MSELSKYEYISLNPQFKSLTPKECTQFRQHARENHKPFEKISELWHPIWREEAEIINEEDSLSNTQYTEDLEANYYDVNFIRPRSL